MSYEQGRVRTLFDELVGARREKFDATNRANAVVIAIVVLFGVRLAVAAATPLTSDECLYWMWSKTLAAGYLDHPPATPILISLGTSLFGDTSFGVRSIGVLLSLPATWAVWRSAVILFKDEKIGAEAALFFTLTLPIAAGSVLMTPDNPSLAATTFLLLGLAKLLDTGRSEWWLAIGVAFGLGMLSKYTTLFFSVSILIWVLAVRDMRHWLRTPWPWISGLVALIVFSPTLLWNFQHGWASILFQGDRLVVREWTLSFLGVFLASQVGMATPPLFVLGFMGLIGFLHREARLLGARVLLLVMVWPLFLYFVWHTFHAHVHGNWPEPLYPAFVVAAAVAARDVNWSSRWRNIAYWSRQSAVPVGVGFTAVIYLQAVFGIVPLGSIDPTARALGAGWPELGATIDEIRQRLGAPVILTTDYRVTAWLSFYAPSRPAVEQIDTRMRYVNAPAPDPALFRGTMMYVCEGECGYQAKMVAARFRTMEQVTKVARRRDGLVIADYSVFRIADPIGDVLDPVKPD
jgi:hypothetical protein